MAKPILFLSILFSSYISAQDSRSNEWKSGHNKIAILKNANAKLGSSIKLSKRDMPFLDQLLNNCISASNAGKDVKEARYLMKLESYNRQYIPFAKNGQRFVLVNCFCDDVKHFPKWKKQVVTVYDGGGCYFTVLINLTRKEYSNLYINGIG